VTLLSPVQLNFSRLEVKPELRVVVRGIKPRMDVLPAKPLAFKKDQQMYRHVSATHVVRT